MGTSVGSAYVTLMPSMKGFSASLNKELGAAGKSAGQSLGRDMSLFGLTSGKQWGTGFTAKMGAAMGVAQSLVSGAMSAIGDSIGAAISRVDQLNNFPKVMKNLGYSADDAQVSVDRMSKAIDGMPTSLDSISGMVQQLAPLTGGLNEATSLGIAFNNMLLAGGASTFDVTRAMQQYTQALGKGKFELEDWRTLREVIPGQLNQVAQALLGAEAGSMDLYEAMKNGKVSIDDFNGAVMRLNTEGTASFASFEQQAKDATQGIGTALTNVQNRISKAIGSIIDAIGAENISGAINAFSSSFSDIGKAAETAIGFIKDNFGTIAPIVAGAVAAFGGFSAATLALDAFSKVMPGLKTGFDTLKIGTSVVMGFGKANGVLAGLRSGLNLVGKALSTAFGGPDGIAVAAIAALVAGLVVAFNTNDGFRNAVMTAWNAIQQAAAAVWPYIQQAITVVMGVIQTVVTTVWPIVQNAFTVAGQVISQIVQAVWPIIQGIITGVMSVIQGIITGVMSVIQGIISAAWPVIQAIFTTACSVIQGVIDTVFPIIEAVISTVMGAISTVISAVMDIIQGDWEGAWSTISSFLSGCWDGMVSTVSGAIGGVVNFFAELPGRILNALGDLGSLLVSAGGDLIQGLINGITGAVGGAIDAVTGAVGSIIDGAKGLLGIHSPSTVFREIGDYTMQGLRLGIEGGARAVRGSALSVASDVASAWAGGISGVPEAAALEFSAAVSPVSSAEPGHRVAEPVHRAGDGWHADLLEALQTLHDDLRAIRREIPEPMSRREFACRVRAVVA